MVRSYKRQDSDVCMEREDRPRSNQVTGGCVRMEGETSGRLDYMHAPESSDMSLSSHFQLFQAISSHFRPWSTDLHALIPRDPCFYSAE
jgi:hypothetical protein